ncbi:NADH-quinone oxidoreductase subunit C [Streptomyces sp. NPDC004284]|uniref:NADH-quinone oxidoreductase subunit C n=1 Tax=Streptomyces sp. NPDC004284 TaxID=3364695 RepID=UPI0036B3AB56
MNAYDSLPGSVTEIFGEEATAEQAYDLLTVDVPPAAWLTALETARDELGCTFFDWLSAVDEPGTGFRVCAHVVSLAGHPRRLLLRTTVPHDAPVLPTATGVYAGAGWHERETHEMFGVAFEGHPHLVPLLLPENFEGHPLRKDFVLAARVAKAWPGAKEPGESHDGGGPKRRQMLPPGVPDPNEWGPLKGQLPPAPTRPARATAGDRPARRTRSATEGSATQPTPATPEPTTPARRTRTASEGSASQTAPAAPETSASSEPGAPVRRSRSAAEGSASQAAPAPDASTDTSAPSARPPRRSRSAADGSVSQAAPAAPEAPDTDASAPRATAATPRTRSSDAPWHHARPAFDEDSAAPEPASPAAPEPSAEAAAEGAEPPAPGPAAPADSPGPEEAPAPEPAAPADAPEPEAPGAVRAAEDTPAEGGPAEPPAGRDGADAPTDPAGGDPA